MKLEWTEIAGLRWISGKFNELSGPGAGYIITVFMEVCGTARIRSGFRLVYKPGGARKIEQLGDYDLLCQAKDAAETHDTVS